MDSEKRPINIEELKNLAKGTIIAIPGYNEEDSINVRVKKIDFSKEMLNGKYNLSSFLTGSIIEELNNTSTDEEREEIIKKEAVKEGGEVIEDMFPMLDNICKECLIEPTFEEFEEVYPLTLNQKYAIFDWVLGGIRDLKPFRSK